MISNRSVFGGVVGKLASLKWMRQITANCGVFGGQDQVIQGVTFTPFNNFK